MNESIPPLLVAHIFFQGVSRARSQWTPPKKDCARTFGHQVPFEQHRMRKRKLKNPIEETPTRSTIPRAFETFSGCLPRGRFPNKLAGWDGPRHFLTQNAEFFWRASKSFWLNGVGVVAWKKTQPPERLARCFAFQLWSSGAPQRSGLSAWQAALTRNFTIPCLIKHTNYPPRSCSMAILGVDSV